MKIERNVLSQSIRNAVSRLSVLAATWVSLAGYAAAPPSISFSTVSSFYTYQGSEDRNTLAAVIAGSSLYCNESLGAATLFGGPDTPCGNVGVENHGYYLDAKFNVPSCNAGLWSFRLGADFGRGGAIFVDGVKLESRVDDIWWGLSWNATGEIMSVNNVNLAAGPHRIEAIGFENCCAGTMSMEFQIGSSGWKELSIANLTPADQDNDGIPDCEDGCPNSITTATVVIDGCDSGVPNLVLVAGCTLADAIAGCANGATNHGKYVSCVSDLTNSLKKAGVLTGAQKGAIERCAAQSDIGK